MCRLRREALRREAQQQQEAAQRAKQAAVAHARLQAEEEEEEIAQQAAAAQAGQQQLLQEQSDMDSVECIGDGGHMGHVDCHENAMYTADIAVQQVCSGTHFASFLKVVTFLCHLTIFQGCIGCKIVLLLMCTCCNLSDQ